MPVPVPRLAARLADPALTTSLTLFVRGRVPQRAVDDIVQATVAEALASPHAPDEDADIPRWVYGIARHKVVDWFRTAQREAPCEPQAVDHAVAAVEPFPESARDLLRWARKELPGGEENEKTLEWMLREGAGEKLEEIAAEANVPAPRVRQRVSRLRRYYKTRWAAQAAALAAIIVIIVVALVASLWKREAPIAPRPLPAVVPQLSPEPPEEPPQVPAMSAEPPVAPEPSAPLAQEKPVAPSPVPRATSAPVPTARSKPAGKGSKSGSSM